MVYRQLNLDNGYQERLNNEMGYLSHDKYPAQNTDYLGKYICVRHRTLYNQMLNQRFHIPANKYDDYIYPQNSGRRRFFRILRWDNTEPFRAILMNEDGEIIVTYTTQLINDLYDIVDNDIYKATISRANKYGYEYLVINETDDLSLFFDKLYDEKVNMVNLQNTDFLGINVWTEYETDLSLDKSEAALVYRNDYKLSEETMKEMIKRDPILYSLPEEIFNTFPYYYNDRENGHADLARRAINQGVIIKYDLSSSVEPEVVVMEILEDESVRFVTQHEARFFYNTEYMENNTDVYGMVSAHFDDINIGEA